ncbi:MAG: LbtU family siderophore porin [Pseudomonadota bacterium]
MKTLSAWLISISVLSYGVNAWSESTSPSAELEQELKTLQAQLAALETKVNSGTLYASPVSVAPYVGVTPAYNGTNLIAYNWDVNNDLTLLQLRQSEIQAYKQLGQTYPDTTRIIFSGELEGESNYTTPYEGTPAGTNFNLTTASLDTFIEANRWVSGFMAFGYNDGSGDQTNRVNNSQLQLDQGFITVGDLTTSPFYSSIGQMYVPFGWYNYDTVNSPVTETLGQVQARAITLAYHSNNTEITPYAAVYGYQGATEIDNNPASNATVEEYGANAALAFASGNFSALVGSSYNSNIAESAGLQGDGSSGSTFNGFAQSSGAENLAYRVPGADVYGSLGYSAYTLLVEYTTATKAFDKNDLSFNHQGAQPQAMDIEFVYAFNSVHPSSVVFDYGQTWQALAIGLPQKNYGVTYNTSFWRNTICGLQLTHNLGYASGSTASGAGQVANLDTVGVSYNAVALSFTLLF